MTPFIKKTALTATIALGALLLIIFVFGNTKPLKTELVKRAPTLRLESLSSLKSYEQVVSTNATHDLAAEIAKELIAQNPEGPEQTESGRQITSIDPEQLVQTVLEKTFSDLKIDDLRPIIKSSDIQVIKSTDLAFAEVYFGEITKIFEEYFPPTLTINQAEPTKTDFAAFLAAFDKTSAALYQVRVPQTLAPLHRELITLIGAQRNAMALIRNYASDPAQAAIAIEAGNRFGLELVSVFNTMDAYIQKHELTITRS